MKFEIEFGRRLAGERHSHGYTQVEAAGLIGVTGPALSNYERGSSFTPLKILAALANLYGCSTDYLIGLETKETQNIGTLQTCADVVKVIERLLASNAIAINEDGGVVLRETIERFFANDGTMKRLVKAGTISSALYNEWRNGALAELGKAELKSDHPQGWPREV